MARKIFFSYKQLDNVGIFNFSGDLIKDHEDELKLILMRAIYSIDRAVLNLKKVGKIDITCLNLLKKAYCTSVRLKNPLIITEVPKNYLTEIYNCESPNLSSTYWTMNRFERIA